MPDHSHADWLKIARQLHREAYGSPVGRLRIILSDEAGQEISWSLPAELPPGPVPVLSPLEADIVRVLSHGPLIGKAIARRLGIKFDTSLRTILANLVERHVVTSTPQGYRLSDQSDTDA